MIRKIISILCILCLSVLLIACSETLDTYLEEATDSSIKETNTMDDIKKPESKVISASFSDSDLFSTSLFKKDPALLQFTKKVEKHIANFDKTFEVAYTGKLDWDEFEVQLNDMNSLLSYVNPYTAGYFLNFEWTSWDQDNGYLIEFTITYLTDAKKEKKVDTFVNQFVVQYITDDMDDFHRAKAINDMIVQLATYTEQGSTEGQTVYELIQENTAVCQAYALLAYRLLVASDLDAQYVYGYSDNELHAWNLVSINDNWYHLDTTWNDVDPNEPYAISYEYFLVNDEKLSQDHLWVKENYFAATSKNYDFMHDMWYADTDEDIIYYNSIRDNMVYAYDLATQQNKQISETACYYLATYKDVLYCSDYDNAGYLTKINVSNGSEEVLLEEEVLNLFIADGILYYQTVDGEEYEQDL